MESDTGLSLPSPCIGLLASRWHIICSLLFPSGFHALATFSAFILASLRWVFLALYGFVCLLAALFCFGVYIPPEVTVREGLLSILWEPQEPTER